MKLLKPNWVGDDKPIFSIDIHPDGSKFATGGQGNESGRVVIWNLQPLLDEQAEFDKTVPKILCQMDNHLACVNCVRWSINGQMLASGGDDKIIMIWKKGKGGSGVFGSSGITKTTESWRCISTLRGHAGDVLDLAWSPQDRWLASCSVDNTIIIWDIQALPAIVSVLKGHTGLVKGVAWDPVGKFMASQSDDRSVKIWKSSDWTNQCTITEPFAECGGTTHILRLSWSPDGQYLVSAHAMNGGGPTAQIIEREGWKCDTDFVGHRKAVTCVRFHNSILKKQTKSNKSQQYCCLAIGSRDSSLSIWMTALQRPLLVIHDLFEDSVLDLSWSTDGCVLLACSGDGTIACLQFTQPELGTPLSEDDKNSLYQRMYGKSAKIDMTAQTGKDMIIENSDMLDVTGDKRKAPKFNIGSTGDDSIVNSNNTSTVLSSTSRLEVIVENSEMKNDLFNVVPISPAKAIHKQIETRRADGKRRITPVYIPLDIEIGESVTPQFASSSGIGTNIVVEKTIEKLTECSSETKSFNGNDETKLDARLTKRVLTAPAKVNLQNIPKIDLESKIEQIAVVPRPTVLTGGKAVPLKGVVTKPSGQLRIQVANGSCNTAYGPLCKVSCLNIAKPEIKIWEIFIGSAAVNISCSFKNVIVCSIDGTLRFFDVSSGILVFPILNLPSPAILCCFSTNNRHGGVLTECGKVRVWNLEERTITLSTSCFDILCGGNPTMMSITETGIVFILLSNGCSFCYSKELEAWCSVNSRDPIFRQGLAGNLPNSLSKNMKTHPLMSIQSTAHVFKPSLKNYLDLSSNLWQHLTKQSFIENQIELCKIINSSDELKYWYSMLGYHLANHGSEERLRTLLDDLMGSGNCFSGGSKIKKEILGVSKHSLLENCLEQLKHQTKWQRLFMEYTDQLSHIKKLDKECEDMDSS